MPGHNPDAVIATGFYRLGIWDDEPADPLQAALRRLDDIVATTGQVFLGMTLNCARCHDHKVDPIPQTDYYKLVAFFRDIRPYSDNRDVRSANSLTRHHARRSSGRSTRRTVQEREARLADVASR